VNCTPANRIGLYGKFADFYSNVAAPILEGDVCVGVLAPESSDFTTAGGTGTIDVTTAKHCSWAAITTSNWILITSGSSGTDDGQISYTVGQNPFSTPRTGLITVGDETHTINQAGVNCSFLTTPPSGSFGPGEGSGEITVTTGANCRWVAQPSDTWIVINTGAQGTGNGKVNYKVEANPSPSQRIGQILIEGQLHSITQSGIECNFSMAPTTATFPHTGGNRTVNVTVAAGCGWTASSNAAWLVVTSGGSGNGNGVVSYSVAPNSSAGTRTGRITVSGKFIDVTQSSGPLIASIVRDGKSLIVVGTNFDAGAKVFVDGVRWKTLQDAATSSTRLVAKKAFKKIGSGRTVSIMVKNSDGSESPSVPFLKPVTAMAMGGLSFDPKGRHVSGRNKQMLRREGISKD
jgi:hypothetical protein